MAEFEVRRAHVGDAPAMATRVRLGSTPGHVQFVSAMGADGASLASDREGGGESLGTLAPKESRSLTVNFNTLQNGAIAVDATAAAKCAHDVTTFANTNIAAVTASALIVTHDPVDASALAPRVGCSVPAGTQWSTRHDPRRPPWQKVLLT